MLVIYVILLSYSYYCYVKTYVYFQPCTMATRDYDGKPTVTLTRVMIMTSSSVVHERP